MIASFVLALREGLEAALIIGVVLGVLRQTGQVSGRRYVWLGAGLAGLLSVAAALGLQALGWALEGRAEQIFEGITMLAAAGLLTWMIFWMSRQGKQMQSDLKRTARAASDQSRHWALFSLALLAVLREGVELALFLTAASFAASAAATWGGALLGLLAAAGAGWLLAASTRRINMRAYFQLTGWLLVLFAAGLVAHGVHEFNEVGWIPSLIEHVWDINHLVDERSGLGEVLKALLGYNANPSLTEVIAYAGYWVILLLAQRPLAGKPLPSPAARL